MACCGCGSWYGGWPASPIPIVGQWARPRALLPAPTYHVELSEGTSVIANAAFTTSAEAKSWALQLAHQIAPSSTSNIWAWSGSTVLGRWFGGAGYWWGDSSYPWSASAYKGGW